ncbi:MAG: DUF5786 family protein [Halobacteriaceae archaeon]
MSLGAYDEDEHERREKKTSTVDISDDTRTEYHGEVEFDSGESAEDLIDQFKKLKSD